ncbi:hypothetical protein [Frankia gtarii]|uniref:hypothetical protein n=1 Tax=Frankia gtarii TaxID=2950102 RepID=UPI0021BFB70A|nr:hypothetical protein [Frankia gtarii]
MTSTADLISRNVKFAAGGFRADLAINPSGNMMVVCCVDPRVDPTRVLGLEQGEAAVIRNVSDWNLILLHHSRRVPGLGPRLRRFHQAGRDRRRAYAGAHRVGSRPLAGLPHSRPTERHRLDRRPTGRRPGDLGEETAVVHDSAPAGGH